MISRHTKTPNIEILFTTNSSDAITVNIGTSTEPTIFDTHIKLHMAIYFKERFAPQRIKEESSELKKQRSKNEING